MSRTSFMDLPVYKDPNVATHRTNEDGSQGPRVLFWQVGDNILVHPDHWAEFHELVMKVNESVARTPSSKDGDL